MKKILINEICNEKPNSQALGAFNDAFENTGGSIKQYGSKGYAIYEDGKQITKAIFDKLDVKMNNVTGKKQVYQQLKFREQNNLNKGKLKIGLAKERY